MVEFDTIVVGVGGVGSAAAYQSARSGSRTLGIEQFGVTHVHGSSHGGTRIYRTAYAEGGAYVPLSRRAQQLFFELQRTSHDPIIRKTGGLYIGALESLTVRGALQSAKTHALPHELLGGEETERRFPQFHLAPSEVAVWDPDAGILFPENCIRAQASAAVDLGAQLHYGEKVKSWSATPDSVTVRTTEGEHRARTLILTAGPWMPKLTLGLGLPLAVERQFVLWFPSTSPELTGPSRMPVFVWDRRPQVDTYGIPDLGEGVKVGAWAGKPTVDPESADRLLGDLEAGPVREFVAGGLRGVAAREASWASCLFTMAPDHNFVVGRHPRHPNVVVVSACSGHGFKFTSVLGEVVARLARGEPPGFDLSLFDPSRFAPPSR